MNTQEMHPACWVGEGTGIDDSIEGKEKKLSQARHDAATARLKLAHLQGASPLVLDEARWKVKDAESRERFWTKELC